MPIEESKRLEIATGTLQSSLALIICLITIWLLYKVIHDKKFQFVKDQLFIILLQQTFEFIGGFFIFIGEFQNSDHWWLYYVTTVLQKFIVSYSIFWLLWNIAFMYWKTALQLMALKIAVVDPESFENCKSTINIHKYNVISTNVKISMAFFWFLRAVLDPLYLRTELGFIQFLVYVVFGILIGYSIVIIYILTKSLKIIEAATVNVKVKDPFVIYLTLFLSFLILIIFIFINGAWMSITIVYKQGKINMLTYFAAWNIIDMIEQPAMTVCLLVVIYTLYLFAYNQSDPVTEQQSDHTSQRRQTKMNHDDAINTDFATYSNLVTENEDEFEEDLNLIHSEDEEQLTEEEKLLQRTILKNLLYGGFQKPKPIDQGLYQDEELQLDYDF